jgi:hypothetical protein
MTRNRWRARRRAKFGFPVWFLAASKFADGARALARFNDLMALNGEAA